MILAYPSCYLLALCDMKHLDRRKHTALQEFQAGGRTIGGDVSLPVSRAAKCPGHELAMTQKEKRSPRPCGKQPRRQRQELLPVQALPS